MSIRTHDGRIVANIWISPIIMRLDGGRCGGGRGGGGRLGPGRTRTQHWCYDGQRTRTANSPVRTVEIPLDYGLSSFSIIPVVRRRRLLAGCKSCDRCWLGGRLGSGGPRLRNMMTQNRQGVVRIRGFHGGSAADGRWRWRGAVKVCGKKQEGITGGGWGVGGGGSGGGCWG